jgi:hypothetical protein
VIVFWIHATIPARCTGEAVDVRHDIARLRDLGRLARRHKAVLQIDDDKRGARRIEIVEGMQSAAPGQRPLDRPGWDFDFVHDLRLSQTLPVLRPARSWNIPFSPRDEICTRDNSQPYGLQC